MNHTNTNTAARPPADGQPVRLNGIVVRRIDKKGFAFIKADDGAEYFVHMSDCVGEQTWGQIEEGSRVTFEPTATAKGPRASFVKLK